MKKELIGDVFNQLRLSRQVGRQKGAGGEIASKPQLYRKSQHGGG